MKKRRASRQATRRNATAYFSLIVIVAVAVVVAGLVFRAPTGQFRATGQSTPNKCGGSAIPSFTTCTDASGNTVQNVASTPIPVTYSNGVFFRVTIPAGARAIAAAAGGVHFIVKSNGDLTLKDSSGNTVVARTPPFRLTFQDTVENTINAKLGTNGHIAGTGMDSDILNML